MQPREPLRIAVLPGDGIGVEVMQQCLVLLHRLQSVIAGLSFKFETLSGGAGHYERTGVALPDETIVRAKSADAILFGAMGMPHIRYPDGREIAPQLDIREQLDLYAGVRPVRTIPGLAPVLSDPRAASIDFVLVRESTEGLFARRLECVRTDDSMATDLLQVTRRATERVAEFAFRLCSKRKRRGTQKVTCVDKANVLGSLAFFREVFNEVAARHKGAAVAEHMYVDAAALNMVRRPWDFDVLVTENMFGDILSDLGAALLGGIGLAPSADIGDHYAMFQPCHGSAPDIAGTGKANPIGMFLSAAMMLDWLSERCAHPAAARGAQAIRDAVDRACASGSLRPIELCGPDDLEAVTAAIIRQVDLRFG